jgi:aspartate aminotransferase
MAAGRTKYTAAGGIRELQRAIIEFYARQFGTEYQPSEVMATAGGKQAIFNAVVTLINPATKR